MKNIGRVTPLLFHCFFLENFNKDMFVEQHEPFIREQSIKKYVFNSPHTILYPSVISMLTHNIHTNKLTIHNNFPKDLLVEIFRPFLFHDYIANYYIRGTSKVYNSKLLLRAKLKKFYEFNPRFGREIIKLTKKNKKIIKREYILNTKHISFYDIVVTQTVETNNIVFLTNNSTINILINNTIFNASNNDDETDTDSDILNATTIYDDDVDNQTYFQDEEDDDSIS